MSHDLVPIRKRRVASSVINPRRRNRNMREGLPMSRRAELLREIAVAAARAKELNLHETAFLLGVAHLGLQTKLAKISSNELEAFAAQARYQFDD